MILLKTDGGGVGRLRRQRRRKTGNCVYYIILPIYVYIYGIVHVCRVGATFVC